MPDFPPARAKCVTHRDKKGPRMRRNEPSVVRHEDPPVGVPAMATQQIPPGPRGLPLVGNTLQWARDPNGFRERCAAEYGPVTNFEMLGWDTYMVTDPDEIERILVSESERFPKHSDS